MLSYIKKAYLELLILLVALVFRVWALDVKPAHFDEGVNGWFVDQMASQGYYNYDSENYHGPWYFYLLYLFFSLFGRDIVTLRLPAVIGSLLGVIALLGFRPIVGLQASRLAALFLAVSPAATFYGRYSIHESWFTTFGILTVLGILGSWCLGKRAYIYLTAIGVTGLLLTKETTIIHIGCLLLAIPTLLLLNRIIPVKTTDPNPPREWNRVHIFQSIGGSCFVLILFYSGFFLDFDGLIKFLKSYAVWIGTGVEEGGHSKPWYYWLQIILRYEWLFGLGLLCGIRFIFPSKHSLRYLAIYATGVLAAYSIVSYKTPWCILTIQWPFYLLLAAVIMEVIKKIPQNMYWSLFLTLPALAFAHDSYEALKLNFVNYDVETEPYAYVQTHREAKNTLSPFIERAKQRPTLYQRKGLIILESYYPLPWLYGLFPNIGYGQGTVPRNGEIYDVPVDIEFVIAEKADRPKLDHLLDKGYKAMEFKLRGSHADCVYYTKSR